MARKNGNVETSNEQGEQVIFDLQAGLFEIVPSNVRSLPIDGPDGKEILVHKENPDWLMKGEEVRNGVKVKLYKYSAKRPCPTMPCSERLNNQGEPEPIVPTTIDELVANYRALVESVIAFDNATHVRLPDGRVIPKRNRIACKLDKNLQEVPIPPLEYFDQMPRNAIRLDLQKRLYRLQVTQAEQDYRDEFGIAAPSGTRKRRIVTEESATAYNPVNELE